MEKDAINIILGKPIITKKLPKKCNKTNHFLKPDFEDTYFIDDLAKIIQILSIPTISAKCTKMSYLIELTEYFILYSISYMIMMLFIQIHVILLIYVKNFIFM